MLIKLRNIWKQFRESICPKRIYQYGSVALAYFDDRTGLEKICDSVDNWFFDKMQNQRYEKSKSSRFRLINWVDKLGNSSDKIKAAEKNGSAYMSEREWGQLTSKAKQRMAQEEKVRFTNKIRFAVSEIKKGRRYSQEWGNKLNELREKH
jgi:hypothetical protein